MKRQVYVISVLLLVCAISWFADAGTKEWSLGHKKAEIVTLIPGLLYALAPPLRNFSAGSLIPGADLGPLAPAAAHGTIVIPILLSLAAVAYMCRVEKGKVPLTLTEMVGFGMLLGSTFSNLWDRLFRHCVIDFMSLSFVDFWLWNVADVGICLGLFLVGVDALRLHRLLPARSVSAQAKTAEA